MIVWLKAWPMWRVPVTFGGGSWMEKFLLFPLNAGAA